MMTAMGQGKDPGKARIIWRSSLLLSPMVATLMKPYLVDSVTNYTGAVIDKNKPEKYKSLMTSEEAAKLKAVHVSRSGLWNRVRLERAELIRPPERREPQNTVQIRKGSLLVY